MKNYLFLCLICCLFFVGGCGEPFLTGFGTGVAATEAIAQARQAELNKAIDNLNTKKLEIDSLIEQVDDSELKNLLQTFVNQETLEKVEQLKTTDWKDPKVIIGYGLALAAALTAGYQKYQRGKVS